MKNLAWLGLCLTVSTLSAPKVGAQTYRILHHFAVRSAPTGTPLVSQGAVYGITASGGHAGAGTVYRISSTGENFTVLHEFTGNDGREPRAGLIRSGDTLYGTTLMGGLFGGGTVFKIQTNGSGFELLKSFNPSIGEGEQPTGSEPMVLVDDTLYGMTEYSGSSNGVAFGWGTVFRLRTDGSGFRVLKQFPGGIESTPWSGLALGGATLYGTTSGWVGANLGTVFRLDIDGGSYTTLWQFSGGADAAFPLSGVVLAGSTLFGSTYYGPENQHYNSGTVFRMNTDGTGFTTLHVFDASGSWPREGLLLADGVLYGPTIRGPGEASFGSIYALTTDGAAFQVLKQFDGTNGSCPSGLAVSGGLLYGVCWSGGAEGGGVLYTIPTPVPRILSGPQSQTAEAGDEVCFMVQVESPLPLTYHLFFNSTNWLFDATTNPLRLSRVQLTQSGTYTVTVSNRFGTSTSPPAELKVIPAVPRRTVPGIVLNGIAGTAIGLEITPNPAGPSGWKPLDTTTLSKTKQWYFDLAEPLDSSRFYRASSTNALTPPSCLEIYPIPTITLSGAPGSTLSLERINQFGPVDSWIPLATLTLTNTTQLFFDTTAPGQPTRRYRVVPLP